MQSVEESKQSIKQKQNQAPFMCKFTYGRIIIQQLGWNPFISKSGRPLFVRECEFENCKGAHDLKNLVPSFQVNQFMATSKQKFNWINMYNCMIKTIRDNFSKISKEDFEEVVKENNYDKLDFIELLKLWRALASTHRAYNNDAMEENKAAIYPNFELPEDIEYFAWSLERITHICPDHEKFLEVVRNHGTMDIGDLCLGTGLNCKYGVGKRSELLCTKDFLTGSCDCLSKEAIQERVASMKQTHLELESEMKKMEDEHAKVLKQPTPVTRGSRYDFLDDEVTVRTAHVLPRNKKTIEQDIYKLKQRIRTIICEISDMENSRMIHFTDFGMVPFEVQLKAHRDEIEAEERAKAAKLQEFDAQIQSVKTVRTVVSLGKLSKKK
jgi:hypothetical protein